MQAVAAAAPARGSMDRGRRLARRRRRRRRLGGPRRRRRRRALAAAAARAAAAPAQAPWTAAAAAAAGGGGGGAFDGYGSGRSTQMDSSRGASSRGAASRLGVTSRGGRRRRRPRRWRWRRPGRRRPALTRAATACTPYEDKGDDDHELLRITASLAASCRPWPLLLALPLAAAAADQRSFADARGRGRRARRALKANDERALVELVRRQVQAPALDRVARRRRRHGVPRRRPGSPRSARSRRAARTGACCWSARRPGRSRFRWSAKAAPGASPPSAASTRSSTGASAATSATPSTCCSTYVDAQREYASRDRDGDGVLQYAAQARQQPGQVRRPVLAGRRAEERGAEPVRPADRGERRPPRRAYQGRRLPRLSLPHPHPPGPAAAGGAYSYVINGRMVAGFAMVAYPAVYGESGVMTFIVNQNGPSSRRTSGKGTAAAAAEDALRSTPGPAGRGDQSDRSPFSFALVAFKEHK